MMSFDGQKSHGLCHATSSSRLLLSLLLLPPPWLLAVAVTATGDDAVRGLGPTRATSTKVHVTRPYPPPPPPPPPKVHSGQETKRYYRGDSGRDGDGDNEDAKARDNESDVICATDSDGVTTETIAWTDEEQVTAGNEPQENYYDESVDDSSLISISWTCYLPLIIMALVWIVGPLLCLVLCDSEKNHEPNEIILKNSHCNCAAKYTNR